jgi:predicted transcriptional regulator
MAMTLRLTEEETAALRKYAENSGRSMQDVAREAIRGYLEDRAKVRADVLARIVREDAALLDLLAQ